MPIRKPITGQSAARNEGNIRLADFLGFVREDLVAAFRREDKAELMRQSAVASGLPPDTYIKRYPSAQ